MKNKEIVEMIQNRIEDIYQSGEYIYQAKELEEILSCIKQLEKRIYKARKMIFDNYGVLDKYGIEMLDDILKGDSDE